MSCQVYCWREFMGCSGQRRMACAILMNSRTTRKTTANSKPAVSSRTTAMMPRIVQRGHHRLSSVRTFPVHCRQSCHGFCGRDSPAGACGAIGATPSISTTSTSISVASLVMWAVPAATNSQCEAPRSNWNGREWKIWRRLEARMLEARNGETPAMPSRCLHFIPGLRP